MTDLSPIHIIRPKPLPFSDAEPEVRRPVPIYAADYRQEEWGISIAAVVAVVLVIALLVML